MRALIVASWSIRTASAAASSSCASAAVVLFLRVQVRGYGVHSIRDHVAPGRTIYADETSHWDSLRARYLTKRINHSVCYSGGQASTNMAESFFSRLRRSKIGIHHHFAGPYLNAYADEMAWRE